jgi:hypothetical protein
MIGFGRIFNMKYVWCNLCGWNWLNFNEKFEEECPICPDTRWGLTYNSDDKFPEEIENLTL